MDFTLADVFRNDMFRVTSLGAAIDRVPYVPNQLAKMQLFEEDGISTTTMVIERRGSSLQLVPSKPRGAPGTPRVGEKRDAVHVTAPHLPTKDYITPDSLQNVRGFGTPNMMVGVKEKRDEIITALSRNLDVTLEYHRLGAINGVILDANGEVLIDLFDLFEIDEPTEQSLGLNAAWSADDGGAIDTKITQIVRLIQDTLGGVSPTGILALCGDQFFDKLRNHPEVRSTYLNQQAANNLRRTGPIQEFSYGGVTWVNYRGWGAVAVPTNKCRFIPQGVPRLFITRFAPAPFFSAVNTKGKPKYVLATIDQSGEKEITVEAQSNPINLCTRPDCLFTGAF